MTTSNSNSFCLPQSNNIASVNSNIAAFTIETTTYGSTQLAAICLDYTTVDNNTAAETKSIRISNGTELALTGLSHKFAGIALDGKGFT